MLSLLLILVLLFVFAAVTLIFYVALPVFYDKYSVKQKEEAQAANKRLEEMFLWIAYRKLILIFGLSPVIIGVVLYIVTTKIIFLFAGIFMGLVLPMFSIRYMERRRKKRFQAQLIDALNSLSQSLKAGLSFLQALEVLVEEMPAPMSQEMALVVKENKMGVSFEESFERLNKKMDSEDLNLMTTAILIARETGGNLTEVFNNLAENIRLKNKVMDQVKTLTTQARWQGVIMSLLPVVFGIVVYKINPTFFDIMWKSDIGRLLLLWCVVSEALGSFMLLKMSKVDV